MDREQKRMARIFALKMAYAYEMTNQDDSLVDGNINIDNSLNEQSEDVVVYSKKNS